jgi:hypothetical protein
MKTIFALLFLLLSLGSLESSSVRAESERTSVSINESDELYELSSIYKKEQYETIRGHVNEHLAPDRLFSSSINEIEATVTLRDGTRFFIRSYPGKLKISIQKGENSDSSVKRIKKMCEGIKSIVS